MKMKRLLLLLSAGMLLAACGESPSPAESSLPATTSSETPVVSSSEVPSVAPSSSSSEVPSEEPSIETTELTTEDTSEIETTEDTVEDTSEISSEISSEVSSEVSASEESSEPVAVAYTLTVGDLAVTLEDVSTGKGETDTWREQYKGTISSANAGDELVFKKGADAIHPGASGNGNNAKYDSETKALTVITGGEDLVVWFKVYDPEEGQTEDGYDIWLTGYEAPISTDYSLTVGGVAVELTNVSASKGQTDTWREQYKGVIKSAKAGDAIVFKKGENAIYPGASGDGNNAKYDSETKALTVITPIEKDTAIWFKVFDPEEGQTADGYDIWLEGYKKAVPTEGDELTATFSVTYETHEGQDLYMIGDFSDWKLPNAVKLTWGEGHVWSGSLKKIEGTEIEYKYIVVEEGKDWIWEGGKNHKYTFAADNLTITDSWQ